MAAQHVNPALLPIRERLREIRGETLQEDMAHRIGVHKNTYARWERGEAEMGISALRRYLDLGWSPLWVLTGCGPRRMDEAEKSPAQKAPAASQAIDDIAAAIEADIDALQSVRARLKRYMERGE